MQPPARLRIGLSLAATWLAGQAWRRVDSGVETLYRGDDLIAIARQAERARLDFLFRPDALFIDRDGLAQTPGFSSLDPTVLMAVIACETDRIGLVTTASTSFNPPYVVARQLQSLHWVSQGRAGWNIVTSLDGQRNFGLESMPSAQERYARAHEFTDLVQALWRSFPHAALQIDRAAGRFADPGQVRPVDHDGAYFRVQGPIGLPETPEGPMPLFQAGASDAGRDFAARHADAVFASSPDIASGLALRRDLRERARRHGRAADAVRVLPGLGLTLARSLREAREIAAAARAADDPQRRIARLGDLIGRDLTDWPMERRLQAADLVAIAPTARSRTHSELLHELIRRESPTLAELLARPESSPSAHWGVIGTVDDAVAAIVERHASGSLDGFIALPGGWRGSIDLFLGEVVPRLAERGLFRADYEGATLRAHLSDGPSNGTVD